MLHLSIEDYIRDTISRSICQGGYYTFGGNTLTVSGTYSDTTQNAAGCDSITVLNLSVEDYITAVLNESICHGGSYMLGIKTLTTAGTYYDTTQTAQGCDSVTILHLIVEDYIRDTISVSICHGGDYPFGDHVLTAAGTYSDTTQTAQGCDSITVLHLSIEDYIRDTISRSICQGGYYTFGGNTLTVSGTYSDTTQNAAGCDSITVLNLSVEDYITAVLNESICHGGSYMLGIKTLTTAGTYYDTTQTAQGCDSVTILHLSIKDYIRDTISNSICYGGSYAFGGKMYQTEGYYSDTTQTAQGCDSITVLHLTVEDVITREAYETICQNQLPYTWRDTIFLANTESGNYEFHRVTAQGCDSIMTLHLTVNPSKTSNVYLTICQNELPYTWGTDTIFPAGTSSGNFEFHKQTSLGCDSIVTLHLTVNPTKLTSEELTLFENQLPYTWRDTIFEEGTESDVFVFHRQTTLGCDSTMILNLTVIPTSTQLEELTICQNQLPYEWRDTLFEEGTESGNYTFYRQTTQGGDSIVTLVLTVNPSKTRDVYDTICQNELPYAWGNDTLFLENTVSDNYVFHRQTSLGCDSVVTLHLKVNPTYNVPDTKTICSSELPYTWNGVSFTAAGTQTTTLPTVNGCDSVVTMTLTVNPSYNVPDTKTICQSELPYTWNGVTFTVAGTQTTTLQTVNGCDSVVTMTLTVTSNTASVDTVEACDTYTWIDGETYTESTNTPTFTLMNAAGCDSIITLHLTMYYTESHYDTVNRCGEYYYVWPRSGDTLTQSGDYVYEHHEGQDVDDDDDDDHQICSHMDYLHLSLGDPSETEIDTIHCGPFEWNDIMYDSSGYYTQYLVNQNGCDSIVHMLLDITHEAVVYIYDTIPATGEGSYPIMWRGDTIWHGGFYSDTVITADGLCDSVYNIIFYTDCNYEVTFTSVVSPALCSNDDAKITVTNVQSDFPPFYYGISVMGTIVWEDSTNVPYHVYDSLSAPDMHVIIVRDNNGCFKSQPTMIMPRPSSELTCPPAIIDTIVYGEPSYISPVDLGMPDYTNWDADRLIFTPVGKPEDDIYPDGLTTIKWIVADTSCGLLDSCEQNINIIFPGCPDAVDCHGYNYSSVRIDNYCWTKINLRSEYYQNADGSCGDSIPCVYEYSSPLHPNAAANVDAFGRLYCFEAAIGDSTINEYGHIQGICPVGWYLPTPEQYLQLNGHGAYSLKSPLYWTDGGGDNSTGFSWLPAGYWNGVAQRFEGLLSEGYFWAAEVVNGEIRPSTILLHHDCETIHETDTYQGMGYSVRCIKERE